uniref:GATOR2 complex protein WDR24 n=1 Tax=Panagrolaimus superbus TaxID=310955 RepID=A0A914YS47_9BILA
MEDRIEPATYTLQLNDPIDAICSDVDFNKVAIIQRCKKEMSRSATVITVLEVKNEKLRVGGSMSFKLGKYKQSSPSSIAWSPVDESMLASSTPLGNILIWDLKHGSIKEDFEGAKAYTAYTSIKFHNFDRNLFATGSTDMFLLLYDMRISRQRPATIFSGNHMSIRDIDLGKHTDTTNQLVAVGDGGNIKFWDLRQPQKHVKEIPAHNGQIMSVTLNQKQKNVFATGGRDKFIRVWDSTKNEGCMYSVETPSAVEKVVWTNESNWHLCSFSSAMTNRDISDCGLYLWDYRRPYIPYKHFQRHEDVVTDVIFPEDPSREIFISCDASGKVLLHKTTDANIPIQQTEYITVACSKTYNECIIATPMYARDLDPKKISNPEDFARKVISRVTIADTSERWTESEKFEYLAKRYKLICPNGESLIDLCKYNSQIAISVGDSELSSSWQLLGILAGNDQISTSRPMLGQQIRSKNEMAPFTSQFSHDTNESLTEEGESGSLPSPKEEPIHLIEPPREFCFDQELLDFSGVLEEESCQISGADEIIPNRPFPFKRRRFIPRMKIVEREEWYSAENGQDEEMINPSKKVKVKRVHRYFGGIRQQLDGIRFQNGRDGQIKRTCISFVFDNSKTTKNDLNGKSSGPQTLEKIKSTYDERVAARKREVAEAERIKRKKSLTKRQKEILRQKRMEKRIRVQNMRWIEDNKLLRPPRTPTTEMHRIIMDRTKIYHTKQTSIEAKEIKEKHKLYGEGYKPTKKKDNWEQIKHLFNYYMALDDVQMVACMALCIGEKVTMLIPEASVDRWFHFYTDLLEQYCLFKEATFFMKACYRVQITQRNCEDNFVKNICVECGNTLMGPICDKCAYEHFCVICENLVYGSWMLCVECGHGGHPEHIREWFNQHDNCPAAFCDHSCFPTKRKNKGYIQRQKTRSGSPTVTYHFRALHGSMIQDADFWKHKIPPH